MAVATHNMNVDGQLILAGNEIPDLGSLECISVDGNKRMYQGQSADVGKLPKYDDLGAGSTAIMLDTGDTYMYSAKTKTWYKQ